MPLEKAVGGVGGGEAPSSPRLVGRQKRSKINARRNARKHRATDFTAWLVGRFGAARLRHGSGQAEGEEGVEGSSSCGVLDVAGGKGKVAYDLAVRRGIPCCVVDPMPVRLSAHTTKLVVAKADREAADAEEARTGTGGRRAVTG